MKSSLALLAALAIIAAPTHAVTFADVVTVNPISEDATGSIAGTEFTVHSTRTAPRPISGDNGGIVSGITDWTSSTFSSNVFTPPLPLGDSILLGAASDFKINFAQPLSRVSLHISQLQANRLTFTSSGAPVVFSLLSGDGDFTISAGNTSIQGSSGGSNDANGSLLFAGPLADLSWTSASGAGANSNTPEDGFRIQISVVPESSTFLLLGAGLVLFIAKSNFRRRR